MKKKLAVIQFPGSNCEYETERAANAQGFDSEIIRWNIEKTKFESFDTYILPGGFSFQDRVRAGAISAKLPILEWIVEAANQKKPILGICNGCQILAETGLVPNINKGNDEDSKTNIEIALTPNKIKTESKEKKRGFVCDWVYVKISNPEKSIFTRKFSDNDIIPIQINHGEGNFKLSNSILNKLNTVTSLKYCTVDGEVSESYPINPNGSTQSLAGLCNADGTVFAMMPHPERGSFLKQVPKWLNDPWSKKKGIAYGEKHEENNARNNDGEGPWAKLFQSLYEGL